LARLTFFFLFLFLIIYASKSKLMKKTYFLLFSLLISVVSVGQITLAIPDGPANGSTVIDDPETSAPGNASIDFVTTNFNVGEPMTITEADGYIVWSAVNINDINNNDGGNIYTANDGFEYPVTGLLNDATYDFTSELVNNIGESLIPAVVYSFTITIAAYVDVLDLAALRAGMVDPDVYYRVAGPVINTNTIDDVDGRIMFFQDATGGIMVNDPDYETGGFTYAIGDAVADIKGHLESVNNVLQFIPTFTNWGMESSSNNTPAIPAVTIATLLTDWEDYESELVRINEVTFADGGGTFVEAAMGGIGDYDITDATGTTNFRSAFGNANYIGQMIPLENQDLVVIVSELSGAVQVTARSFTDFTLDSETFDLNEFKIYPNPTSTGFVNIKARSYDDMSVVVFDILGKLVISQKVDNQRLDVSILNAGIYVMRISQNNNTVTKKLVIK